MLGLPTRGVTVLVRSAARGWQLQADATLSPPFWLAGENRQPSARTGRCAALASTWLVAALLALFSAACASPVTDNPIAQPTQLPRTEPNANTTPSDESGCYDFATQEDAQAFYEGAGGPSEDPHGLDADQNGFACGGLPRATTAPKQTSPSDVERRPIAAPLPRDEPTPFDEPDPENPQAPSGEHQQPSNCDPNYSGCLDPSASDYDCEGGSGNGPEYTGPVEVRGNDHYDLDRDDDGYGCEDS